MTYRTWIVLVFMAVGSSAMGWAKDEDYYMKAGPLQNTMVQLFTSDASPNCNAALTWMNSQKDKDPKMVLWKTFVPAAMHVKQWDVPDYKDSFGKKEFDAMLLEYKKHWKATKVYAPTLVVNGQEWSGWSRGQDIPLEANKNTGVLSIDGFKKKGFFEATFTPDATLAGDSFTLHGSLLAFGLRSRPSGGKNKGAALQHEFAAILYKSQDFKTTTDGLRATVELPKLKGVRVQRYAVALWVTRKGSVLPVQSTGGFLPNE